MSGGFVWVVFLFIWKFPPRTWPFSLAGLPPWKKEEKNVKDFSKIPPSFDGRELHLPPRHLFSNSSSPSPRIKKKKFLKNRKPSPRKPLSKQSGFPSAFSPLVTCFQNFSTIKMEIHPSHHPSIEFVRLLHHLCIFVNQTYTLRSRSNKKGEREKSFPHLLAAIVFLVLDSQYLSSFFSEETNCLALFLMIGWGRSSSMSKARALGSKSAPGTVARARSYQFCVD